jgi:hypothetical protein
MAKVFENGIARSIAETVILLGAFTLSAVIVDAVLDEFAASLELTPQERWLVYRSGTLALTVLMLLGYSRYGRPNG